MSAVVSRLAATAQAGPNDRLPDTFPGVGGVKTPWEPLKLAFDRSQALQHYARPFKPETLSTHHARKNLH